MKNFKSGAQLALYIITHILGITISILIFYWAGEYLDFSRWKGYGKYVWHPPLMVLGTVYLLGIALTSYRLTSCKENVQSTTHLILNIVMVALTVFALAVVIDVMYYNDHFTTLHGLFGLITVCILFIELPVFIIVYAFDCCPNDVKEKLMPLHKYSGIIILLLSLVSNLTGVQKHNSTMFNERMLLNVIGLLIFIFTLIILFVLIEKKGGGGGGE